MTIYSRALWHVFDLLVFLLGSIGVFGLMKEYSLSERFSTLRDFISLLKKRWQSGAAFLIASVYLLYRIAVAWVNWR